MYQAKVIADSLSPGSVRLTTVQCSYPAIIHNEVMTHRAFSRNTSSNRALPVSKIIDMVMNDPFVPIYWGKEQKGMVAQEELVGSNKELAETLWLQARDHAVEQTQRMIELGVHKQIANRLLQPWQWMTAVISATDWDNFFNLRCHPDAQPEIRKLAEMIRDAMRSSTITQRNFGDWHTPYVDWQEAVDLSPSEQRMVSVARCARVSYLTQEGTRNIEKDLALYDRLISARPIHASPLEHVAQATAWPYKKYGNFRGWKQLRQDVELNSNSRSHPYGHESSQQ
jgi:thymidylate synthase ThyX